MNCRSIVNAILLASLASPSSGKLEYASSNVDYSFDSYLEALSSPEEVTDYIVKFKDSGSYNNFQAQRHSLDIVQSIPRINADVLKFPSSEAAKEWSRSREDVQYIEKDERIRIMGEQVPYGITLVNALDGMPDYKVGSGIKVCIVDSGFDKGHEDLQTSNIQGSGTCTDDPCDWDSDPNSHGTHVAGTIAAIGGNGKGVSGVIRNGSMPLHIERTLSASGNGTYGRLIRSIENCEAAGANIVNLSLGTAVSTRALIETLAEIKATNDRILFFAASGNKGNGEYSFPASVKSSIMMSVASINADKSHSWFSQHNDQVDIAAPGSAIRSTIPNNRYASYTGTSMATPHACGVAALVWSHYPEMTAAEIRYALETSAEDLGDAGRDDYFGHGLVNAKGALEVLQALAPKPVTKAPTKPPTPSPTNSPSKLLKDGGAPIKSTCIEYSPKTFLYKMEDDSNGERTIAVTKSCLWLSYQSEQRQMNICNRTLRKFGYGLARNTCSVTCNTCPSNSCKEKTSSQFFAKVRDDGSPVYKKCGFLAANQYRINKYCSGTKSRSGRGPAREVCPATCQRKEN